MPAKTPIRVIALEEDGVRRATATTSRRRLDSSASSFKDWIRETKPLWREQRARKHGFWTVEYVRGDGVVRAAVGALELEAVLVDAKHRRTLRRTAMYQRAAKG